MQGELEYYAARSGLASGTLDDHKMAFFRAQTGGGAGTLVDLELKYLQAQNADTTPNLQFQRLKYYTAKSGATGTIDDVMQDFFSAPPSGGGAKPQHQIWSGAAPAVTNGNDGKAIRAATAFYVIGVSGWKVVGGRLFVPAGAAATGWKAQLWDGTVDHTTLATATPLQQVALTGVTPGQAKAFSFSPQVMTAGQPYRIGFESAGDYPFATVAGNVQAGDGAPVYLSNTDETFPRTIWSYLDSSAHNIATWWAGVDILVEEA